MQLIQLVTKTAVLPSGAVLGPSWAVLGPSWGPHVPSWDDLGGPSGRFTRCQGEKGECAKNVRCPQGMKRFFASWGPLGGPLGALLGRLGGLLGCVETILDRRWAALETLLQNYLKDLV